MSYQFYKILHVFGVILTFAALGGTAIAAMVRSDDQGARKLTGGTHGAALLIVLISGFGALGKAGLGFDLWVWMKLTIWLVIGAALAFVRRAPHLARFYWFALPALGAAAAYLAVFKPGAG